ncbi:MAG: bifunctional folylpolyglutamate synthase/dihydrofolate synthase [Campylobacteraceae bacterium]|jgi:dihydrofolate synthase/folylpolyglutamate synthase|nr:bifunctional folylpolyglutamate synthase/dihydrofolate synthase [Campylobacteraceae bacterium]
MNLQKYLSNKPLYCEHIDYDRMPRVFKSISHNFKFPKVIHVVGTNGKGTTGRYIAKMLELEGFKTGHYTSPHILEFNERIYKNGKVISNDELEVLHVRLLGILKDYADELSYFEYATLLAFLYFEDCDYAVIEAGVGGEFDATNAAPKILSVVTPISIDHQDLLGNSIKEIALTKLRSVNSKAVIAPQKYEEALGIIRQREAICGFEFLYVDENEKEAEVEKYAEKFSLPSFLKQNLLTAYKAVKFLGIFSDLSKLQALDLRGRCEQIAPNITLDVGHNIDAAKALVRHFDDKKIVLIYNSYKDKDYAGVLNILKPIIKRLELIDITNPMRQHAKQEIKKLLKTLNVKCENYRQANKNDEYLVFGSFGVAESFLKSLHEK